VGPNRIASGGDDSLRQFPANVSVDAYRLSVGNNELLAWQDASIYTRLDDIPDLTCNSSTARVLGSGGRWSICITAVFTCSIPALCSDDATAISPTISVTLFTEAFIASRLV
jgi:hypothetical protein